LTNTQISQSEIARQQIKEIADIERAGMTTRYAKQGATTGAVIGALGMLLSFSLFGIVAGGVIGCAVGWFVSWRKWGQFRTSFLYIGTMLPVLLMVSLSPFTFLSMLAAGMVLGLAIQLNQGR